MKYYVRNQGGTPVLADVLTVGGNAKNGIQLNGALLVSQQNGTTALTASGAVPADGASVVWAGGMAITHKLVTNSPFSSYPQSKNAIEIEVTTADASVAAGDFLFAEHRIEGYQMVGFGWGTSKARPMSIGRMIRSNVSMRGYVAVKNGSVNSRAYVKAFDLVANVDTWVAITIPGDTAGTWLTDAGWGLNVTITFMAGSSLHGTAATWLGANAYAGSDVGNLCAAVGNKAWLGPYIIVPGGDGASSPELPSADNLLSVLPRLAQELDACKRYFKPIPAGTIVGLAVSANLFYGGGLVGLCPAMRAAPTLLTGTYTPNAGNAGTAALLAANTDFVNFYNSANNWTVNAFISVAATLDARL